MKTIAIIGGGFSGTMTAIQLLRKVSSPLTLYLIERENLARGTAYGADSEALLLNVRVDQMGAFPEDKAGFYNWLKTKIKCSPTDFVPRKFYGDYLNELLHNALKNIQPSLKIIIIKDEVKNIEGKTLIFSSHPPILIDEIVLALGFSTETHLSTIENTNNLITIIGTGLSMIDAVIYLKSINYQGKILAVSRRGRLPQEHIFYLSNTPLPHFDFTDQYALEYVLKTTKAALKKFEWRLVIDVLRQHAQFLWSHWSVKERRRFLRYLRPLWDIHRHRMPSEHKIIIDTLIKNHQLTIKAIGFKPFKANEGIVLNCMGASVVKNSLIQQLTKTKMLEIDQFELGVRSLVPWIHTIGPLKRGELWESTAVAEIRIQAKELADLIT